MSDVFDFDVRICGTAYIRAETEEAAREIVRGMRLDSLELIEDREAEIPISGQHLDDENLPDVSLSPAMTIWGLEDEQPEKALAETVKGFLLDHDNGLGPDVQRLRDALGQFGKGA